MFDYDNIAHASKAELADFIEAHGLHPPDALITRAGVLRDKIYGKRVFMRALVEFSNHCTKGCYYCGLNRGNQTVNRYRLSEQEILDALTRARSFGFNSFVLQSGEDAYYRGGKLVNIVRAIKAHFPGTALTLSVGELFQDEYKSLFSAGADRFLLRHETANACHYERLHPPGMTLASRLECLQALKKAGFITGAGFMVGRPYETSEHLAEDLIFLREFQPHMAGIGPFIPQSDTMFHDFKAGSPQLTVTMVALTRLMLPRATLPTTTALATLSKEAAFLAIKAGANVIMPNFTPETRQGDYAIYNGKKGIQKSTEGGLAALIRDLDEIGFTADFSRGDPLVKEG